MKTVKLNNGYEMPLVGLGSYKAKDPIEAKNAILCALDAGYRLIDTAAFYQNEEVVGAAIRETKVPREEIFVVTKVWVDAISEGKVKDSFNASMKRLGLDYVDLFLLHWPVNKEANIKAYKDMEDICKEGRAKSIGLSNYTEKNIDEILEIASIKPVFNQVELHPDFTQDKIYEYCKSKDIVLGAWSPLGGQKSNSGSLFTDETLLGLANKYNKSVAQIIIRWNVQRGIVCIPKSVHEERIRSNFDVWDFEISEEDMKEIGAMNKDNRLDNDPDVFFTSWAARENPSRTEY